MYTVINCVERDVAIMVVGIQFQTVLANKEFYIISKKSSCTQLQTV